MKEVVDWDTAEARLLGRWTASSRLVDCLARTLPLPVGNNAERVHGEAAKKRRGVDFEGMERIEMRGVWPILVHAEVAGLVLVPDVQQFEPTQTTAAPERLAAPTFALSRGHLGLQNRYVEHWVMIDRAFPFLNVEILVTGGIKAPFDVGESTFFSDIQGKVTSRGSYTEVVCSTWVQV